MKSWPAGLEVASRPGVPRAFRPFAGWIASILVLTHWLPVRSQAGGFPQASQLGTTVPAADHSRQDAAPTPPKLNLRPAPPEPVDDTEITGSIDRIVIYLINDSNTDGSWGSPEWTKNLNILAGIGSQHAFRTAVTALCVSALIEASNPRNKLDDPAAVRLSIERGEQFLFRELPRVRRDRPMLIYNV